MSVEVWNPIGIILDPSDPQWKEKVSKARFNLPIGRVECVVSFYDPAVGLVLQPGWPAAVHWRDLIPTDVYDNYWRESYQQIKRLLNSFAVNTRLWIKPYLHVFADALTRHRVWDYLARSSCPEVVLLPINSELKNKISASYYQHNRLYRFVGGKANLLRIFSWAKFKKGRSPHPSDLTVHQPASLSGVLMLVEDGVSAVHRAPAIAIANELKRLGFPPRIVTSSLAITAAFAKEGHEVRMVQPRSLIRLAMNGMRSAFPIYLRIFYGLVRSTAIKKELPSSFVSWLKLNAFGYLVRRMILLEALEQAQSERPLQFILTLGETFPLALVGLDWAQEHQISNAGFTPVLIGGRPDNEDFPATIHFVYGEQAADWMQSQGVPAESIRVVGSTIFDMSLGRDKLADTAMVRATLLPDWRHNQRLVVLATEALSRPEKELLPMLRACMALNDVYTAVKVHPADSLDAISLVIKSIGADESRFTVLSKCDLDALLNAADLLICVQSNIAINAAMMGTPTLCLAYSGRPRAVDLTEGGFAVPCHSEEQAGFLIDNLTKHGPFRENALEMMGQGIKRFAGKADGKSHEHIADLVAKLAGYSCADKFELL